MKLELKHLAPYLPYGLKFKGENSIYEMDGLFNDISIHFKETNRIDYFHYHPQVKPILRPLSQLTETIEHNGEKFVPLVELAKVQYPSVIFEIIENECVGRLSIGVVLEFFIQDEIPFYKEFHNNIFGQTKGSDFDDMTLANITPSEIREKLLEWHFDVFGLLEQGLAVELK